MQVIPNEKSKFVESVSKTNLKYSSRSVFIHVIHSDQEVASNISVIKVLLHWLNVFTLMVFEGSTLYPQ
jgi:hypothetical protein